MSLIGKGTTGTVYQLSNLIAIKIARSGEFEEADHANEQALFELIAKHPPIPYLIHCFYYTPGSIFLEFAPNGSIAALLEEYQQRDWNSTLRPGQRVLSVTQPLDQQDIRRWMSQLCIAVVGLEEVGICHGDVRTANMLLDGKRDLRLCDLDRGWMMENDGDDGDGAGIVGVGAVRTGCFAVGTVFYTLLRGYEPFETEDFGGAYGPMAMEKLSRRELPPLNDSADDEIVRKCWNREYRSVSELLREFNGGEQSKAVGLDQAWMEMRRLECEKFVESALVDTLERY